jgi:hypothetical protein
MSAAVRRATTSARAWLDGKMIEKKRMVTVSAGAGAAPAMLRR